MAHADRPPALLPRSRLDGRGRRAAAGLPPATGHAGHVRRAANRRDRRARGHRALPDPALEMVDPLGIPGQPVHAVAVSRRADDLDVAAGRLEGWHRGQRLDRGGQPERRGGRPRDRLAPDARGHRVHVPRAGARHRCADRRDQRQARRYPQLADPAADQADAPDRRLRAAVVRLQLPGADRQPARRGHDDPAPQPGGDLLMRVMAQMAMVMNLDKCIGCHTCSVTCKQAWTNRSGVEYVWFNNVETRPGQGYPRYYEPWMYDYENLITAPPQEHSPVARPKSLISGKDMKVSWSANWDDDLGGGPALTAADPVLRKISDDVRLEFERTFMFYLPRICEHCLNPSCAASCPSGAIYKRSEDGIVLVDQDRCRGWRMCVTGCPYKKVYFNHRTGKA